MFVFGVFWSVISRIGTKYGDILRISPYSVRMRENKKQNNSEYGHFLRSVMSQVQSTFPLGKITSRGCPEDVPKKRPDVLRTSPYGPICNAKGCILSGTSLGSTQDVNLTIIHKMDFHGFFYIFPDSNCISDNALPK